VFAKQLDDFYVACLNGELERSVEADAIVTATPDVCAARECGADSWHVRAPDCFA